MPSRLGGECPQLPREAAGSQAIGPRLIGEGRGNQALADALIETERRVDALREELEALRRSRRKVFQTPPPVERIEERLSRVQEVLERRTEQLPTKPERLACPPNRSSSRAYLLALDIQDLLRAEYNGQLDQRIEGIAAMPSMQVAIPVLLAGTGWRIHRWQSGR